MGFRGLYLAVIALIISVQFVAAQMMENVIYQAPSIPKTIIEQSDRVEFIVRSYWQNYDFKQSSLTENHRYSEGAYRGFVRLTSLLSDEKFIDAHRELLTRAVVNPDMVNYFAKLSDKYYFAGDSVSIDRDRYMMLLSQFINLRGLKSSLKSRFANRLESLKPVVVEPEPTIAPDIEFTRQDLTRVDLYSIRSRYILLKLDGVESEQNDTIGAAIVADSLLLAFHDTEVVSLCRGVDVEWWSGEELPTWWINGCDEGRMADESRLYGDNSEAKLFLLDSRKRVILENTPIEQIIKYLRGLGLPPTPEIEEPIVPKGVSDTLSHQ
ncbi:MAG: DUF5106 domain-containing protein [Rikenellaceae bacterium]